MTAPDRMPEAFENSLHDAGHPHMEPPANPGRFYGTLDSQVGARICNGLGIMRACLETRKLEQLESRMDEIADRVAHEDRRCARKDQHP